METRRKLRRLHHLNDHDIYSAINADEQIDENENENESDLDDSSDEQFDDATDSEQDCVENDEENSSDDDSEMLDEEMAEETEYLGKDQTKWSSQPQLNDRFRHPPTTKLHKVNLPPGKHIDNAAESFQMIFDDTIIETMVRCTNLEARKWKSKWKSIDAVQSLGATHAKVKNRAKMKLNQIERTKF